MSQWCLLRRRPRRRRVAEVIESCVVACRHAQAHDAVYSGPMGKTVQIRDIPDETYLRLVQRAAESGITVPDLLRREAERLARRPSIAEWLARAQRLGGNGRESDVMEALDEVRGAWPGV